MNSDFFPTPRDNEPQQSETPAQDAPSAPEGHPAVTNAHEEAPTSATVFADKLSTAVSWIFVPLLMPLYALWFVFSFSIVSVIPLGMKWEITALFFALDVVIPALLVMLLKWLGLVEDIGLNGRRERLIPYLISIAVMAATGFWCQRLGMPGWVPMFYYGGAAAGLINLIVNFWWKISAHAAAMSGVLALLVYMSGNGFSDATLTWVVIWTLLTGLLGSARVWLGRHTVMQVFCGAACGFGTVTLFLYL